MKVVRGDALLELGKSLAELEQLAKNMQEKMARNRDAELRRVRIVLGLYLLGAFCLGAFLQWLIFQ